MRRNGLTNVYYDLSLVLRTSGLAPLGAAPKQLADLTAHSPSGRTGPLEIFPKPSSGLATHWSYRSRGRPSRIGHPANRRPRYRWLRSVTQQTAPNSATRLRAD